MSTSELPSPLREEDYGAIEAAVMETARGRWFLAEYARRNRHADTLSILGTLDKLERVIRRERANPDTDRVRLDLADMAQAIERTKVELAELRDATSDGGRVAGATRDLEAAVETAETATTEILAAAEEIEMTAAELRSRGGDDRLCRAIEERVTRIYAACTFQDLTGQRTRKVADVLDYLDSRIAAMMEIWAADGMPPPSGRTAEAFRDGGATFNDQATIDLLVQDVIFRDAADVLDDPADHQVLDLAEDEDAIAFVPASESADIASAAAPSQAEARALATEAAVPAAPDRSPDEPLTLAATAPAFLAPAFPAKAPVDDPLARYDAITRLLVFG